MDNSIDEALAGRCDRTEIIFSEDGSVSVEDNGSGIPVETHPKTGKSTLETVLTFLHAGGKFKAGAYTVSGGLHGVGVSVVNALSEKLVATIKRDGHIYRQTFRRGVAEGPIEVVEDTEETGTTIRFFPDAMIFDELGFDNEALTTRFREMAFLNKGVKIIFDDRRNGLNRSFITKEAALLSSI